MEFIIQIQDFPVNIWENILQVTYGTAYSSYIWKKFVIPKLQHSKLLPFYKGFKLII